MPFVTESSSTISVKAYFSIITRTPEWCAKLSRQAHIVDDYAAPLHVLCTVLDFYFDSEELRVNR